MLKHRLLSSLGFAVLLLVAIFWLPPLGLLALLLLVGGIATWEFYNLIGAARIPHFPRVGLVGGLTLIAATWVSLRMTHSAAADGEWLVLILITLGILVRQFPQKNNPQPIQTIAVTLLGVLYVPFLFNFLTKLLLAWGDTEGRILLLYLIVVVKITDVGAYFVGCSMGRHKLIPRISPAKSWEGTVGGVLAGIAASVLCYLISGGNLHVVRMDLFDAVFLGGVLAVCGTIGDLAESLFKRAAGVKDSGRLILGMGGLLDVIDSLLFAAPALYVYSRLFMERLN